MLTSTVFWIRGECNILSDAPSRAPIDFLAERLKLPEGPIHHLIRRMYGEWIAVGKEVQGMTKQDWSPFPDQAPLPVPVIPDLVDSDSVSNASTPHFGDAPRFGRELYIVSVWL